MHDILPTHAYTYTYRALELELDETGIRTMFDAWDVDGDRILTHEELVGPLEVPTNVGPRAVRSKSKVLNVHVVRTSDPSNRPTQEYLHKWINLGLGDLKARTRAEQEGQPV